VVERKRGARAVCTHESPDNRKPCHDSMSRHCPNGERERAACAMMSQRTWQEGVVTVGDAVPAADRFCWREVLA
jgi:hypothetical protein